MKINFLWDEKRTERLFKYFLYLFLIGGIFGFFQVYFLVEDITIKPYLLINMVGIIINCTIMFILIGRFSSRCLFFAFMVLMQVSAVIFMLLTGNFHEQPVLVPLLLLVFTMFELGQDSTLIIGVFSVFLFTAAFIFDYRFNYYNGIINEFVGYIGFYILLILMERSIGKELSIQLEAKRKLEELNNLKDQFIGLSSHYLRTPVTIIHANVLKLKDNDDKKDLYITSIEENITKLKILINKFLAISSLEDSKTILTYTKADINEVVRKTIAEFESILIKKNIKVRFEAGKIDNFLFDYMKIEEVLVELMDNAIKYNKVNGEIIIETRIVDKYVEISIKDTGIGIPKERQDLLFSSFNKGGFEKVLKFDIQGTGLGLYLAKLLVDSHKGFLEVESEAGKGTTFYIRIPVDRV